MYLILSHLFHQVLKTPCKELFFFPFADKETEAKRKQRDCSRTQTWYLMKSGFKSELAESQGPMCREKWKIWQTRERS